MTLILAGRLVTKQEKQLFVVFHSQIVSFTSNFSHFAGKESSVIIRKFMFRKIKITFGIRASLYEIHLIYQFRRSDVLHLYPINCCL